MNGIEAEKQREVELAIRFYEANVAARFEGSHPYTRLAIIYSKMKRYKDEKRVLEVAIDVFEKCAALDEGYSDKTVIKFKECLAKVEQKLSKAQNP
jgi:hypothetical protein